MADKYEQKTMWTTPLKKVVTKKSQFSFCIVDCWHFDRVISPIGMDDCVFIFLEIYFVKRQRKTDI